MALMVPWTVALPIIVFNDWWIPKVYGRYVERVTAIDISNFKPVTPSRGQNVASTPVPRTTAPIKINPEDFDDVNPDDSPLKLYDWVNSDTGHPRYYGTLATLLPVAWGLGLVGSLPWLWYFMLLRVTELASLFRKD